MPVNRLTQRRVDALKARKKFCNIRDGKLRGFGARVLPSGHKHYFLHTQVRGRRTWKRIGDTDAVTLTRARGRARSILTAQRNGDDGIVRDRGRRGVPPLLQELETPYAEGQPRLLQEPDPAVVQGTSDSGHHG